MAEEINLGLRIKQIRSDLNLSASELADKLKVSRAAVSQWETGRNTPTLENLKAISELANIPLDEVVSPPQFIHLELDKIVEDYLGSRERKESIVIQTGINNFIKVANNKQKTLILQHIFRRCTKKDLMLIFKILCDEMSKRIT